VKTSPRRGNGRGPAKSILPDETGEYENAVKDKAHAAMPTNELNQTGKSKTTSGGPFPAAFQPKAGSWNRNTGLILEVSRKGRGQAAPAKFSQQETI
jgi:hypothetical protein